MKIKTYQLLAFALLVSLPVGFISVLAENQRNVKDRVVMLDFVGGNCTGVILQTNMVLTCAHCTTKPLTLNSKPTKVLKQDIALDLAVLLVETPVTERIKFSDCQVSERVYTWGHPMGERSLFYSEGYVMNVSSETIMASTITLPGASGSPLFAPDGSLVGLLFGRKGPNGYDFPVATVTPAKTINVS